MNESDGAHLLRRQRLWRYAKWACFAIITVAVVIALSSALTRLQNTSDMIEDGSAGSRAYREMSERATFRTMLGLSVGCGGMLAYMACFLMHQRAQRAVRAWQDQERRTRLTELHPEDGDLPNPGLSNRESDD